MPVGNLAAAVRAVPGPLGHRDVRTDRHLCDERDEGGQLGGNDHEPDAEGADAGASLDVYFSDPALGGNKISAPHPIGGVAIDLTKICKMLDGSGGVATCGGTYQNVSAVFGGASSLTVSQMLTYAASQSNVGGTVWYGQVKATQELAKNAFDAINNQVAFAA
jgi:hypothetical protein